ncbi:MAG: PilX N-terminal domain-containing pilus assembly protein [Halopseudomonas sp.]
MNHFPHIQQQRGMVLIVCLLVIVVVTLIAGTAMRTSGMEEKMAANAQTYNRTFQAAESAVELGIDSDTMMFESIDASDSLSSVTSASIGSHGVVATAQTEFRGEGIAPGNSIGSATTFMYEVIGTGEMETMNASTVIRQGYYRVSFVASTDDQ